MTDELQADVILRVKGGAVDNVIGTATIVGEYSPITDQDRRGNEPEGATFRIDSVDVPETLRRFADEHAVKLAEAEGAQVIQYALIDPKRPARADTAEMPPSRARAIVELRIANALASMPDSAREYADVEVGVKMSVLRVLLDGVRS